MAFNRRTLLKGVSVSALGLSAPALIRSARADAPIKMAALLDQSGGLELLGTPMLEATKLAVKEINASGGLLGRQIELITYDPQTTILVLHAVRDAGCGRRTR